MMELLGIKSLRPGANPNNPNATNAVNLDEAKANPYSNLPDPLVLKNGDRVTSAEMWLNKRRPEIVEDFDREIYGRVPTNVLTASLRGPIADECPKVLDALVRSYQNFLNDTYQNVSEKAAQFIMNAQATLNVDSSRQL